VGFELKRRNLRQSAWPDPGFLGFCGWERGMGDPWALGAAPAGAAGGGRFCPSWADN
jgi:hypothetical protein